MIWEALGVGGCLSLGIPLLVMLLAVSARPVPRLARPSSGEALVVMPWPDRGDSKPRAVVRGVAVYRTEREQVRRISLMPFTVPVTLPPPYVVRRDIPIRVIPNADGVLRFFFAGGSVGPPWTLATMEAVRALDRDLMDLADRMPANEVPEDRPDIFLARATARGTPRLNELGLELAVPRAFLDEPASSGPYR